MEKRNKSRATSPQIRKRLPQPQQIERTRFARSMTRSVFGKFYWNDRMETELLESLEASKKRLADKQKRAKQAARREQYK